MEEFARITIDFSSRSKLMTSTNPIIDDLAELVTGTMGIVRTIGDEVDTVVRSKLESTITDMDFARRDEVDALKSLTQTCLARIEELEQRVAQLESTQNEPKVLKKTRSKKKTT